MEFPSGSVDASQDIVTLVPVLNAPVAVMKGGTEGALFGGTYTLPLTYQ